MRPAARHRPCNFVNITLSHSALETASPSSYSGVMKPGRRQLRWLEHALPLSLFFGRSLFFTEISCFAADQTQPAVGNRLAYLDDPTNPFYPNLHFAKLITPQWVGEPGVEAVVVLAVDDMSETKKYEAFLRPILDRLKQIDGRASMSIMTCKV